jgi:hypothetical protein
MKGMKFHSKNAITNNMRFITKGKEVEMSLKENMGKSKMENFKKWDLLKCNILLRIIVISCQIATNPNDK